jgi:hypothetical protein
VCVDSNRRDYPAACGRHVRCGSRQSIPSSKYPSWAGVIVTKPSAGDGQMKRPPLQPLSKQAHPLAVVPQRLDQPTAPATEDEQVAAMRGGAGQRTVVLVEVIVGIDADIGRRAPTVARRGRETRPAGRRLPLEIFAVCGLATCR